ncbi:MAG: YkgJ family cysteine cluster protein [Pirellulales bacterium]
MSKQINHNWNPHLLSGDKLREWAHATSETTTVQRLLTNRTQDSARGLARELQTGAQLAIDAGPNNAERACFKGCPACCHSMISLTALETCGIAEWLRENLTNEKIASIRKHADENANQSSNLNDLQYSQAMLWCPLLDSQKSCSIYPARPIVCQAWNSLSLEACQDCYLANHAEKKIPIDSHAYEVGQGIRSGMKQGLKALGLDGNSYELNSALVVAIDHPDALDLWAKGEEVFEGCHIL